MNDVSRAVRIFLAFWGYGAWLLLVHWRLIRSVEHPAARLCRTLETLGTAFVKLGQMISLRRDLLPDGYARALEGLQDHVAPFPVPVARREIEHALGKSIDTLFSHFEDEPMAAASIAQVHRAELEDGRAVVVKVRRPDIKGQVARDVRLLGFVLRILCLLFPPLHKYRPLELLDDFRANMRKEMDFRLEARNIRRFAKAFRGSTTVYIPDVVEDLVSESVMVQVMSGGCSVNEPAVPADGPDLAQAFVDAYMHQFFVIGAFHGDPHPGNLFITDDRRICFHDFGLVGVLDNATRTGLAGYMHALYHQDAGWLLEACMDLGIVARDADDARLRREVNDLLEEFASRSLKDWSIADPFIRLLRFSADGAVHVPHNLMVLIRTLYLVESTVRMLDPDFSMIDGLGAALDERSKNVHGQSHDAAAQARLKFESTVAARELQTNMGGWIRKVRLNGIEPTVRHHGFEPLAQSLRRGANRISLALVTLGLYTAASLLMQHSLGPRIWGVPILAAVGYALALWFTFRLILAIGRSREL